MRRDEAGAPGALAAAHPEVEEVAEERDRGHHAHKRLTIECKDQQEEGGVGMKVKGVDPIMVGDGEEETGEGGEPRLDVVQKEGLKGFTQGFQLGGADPECHHSFLIAAARCQRVHDGKVLLLRNGGRAQGQLELGRRACGRG